MFLTTTREPHLRSSVYVLATAIPDRSIIENCVVLCPSGVSGISVESDALGVAFCRSIVLASPCA